MTDMHKPGTWILLRGLGRESAHWMDFVARLQRHLPRQRIVCIDWPGNGQYIDMQSPCTIAEGVTHLRQVCTAQSLEPPYVLVGISMGGMAALDWLAHYPEEVAHVHAINTSVGGISYWYERMRIGGMLQLLGAARSLARREQVVFTRTLSLCREREVILARWLEIATARPVKRANLLRQIWSAVQFSVRKPLHSSHLTLYVSRNDHLVNPECSRDMALRWNVPLLEHDTAGHDLPLDDGEWLAEKLKRWAESSPRRWSEPLAEQNLFTCLQSFRIGARLESGHRLARAEWWQAF